MKGLIFTFFIGMISVNAQNVNIKLHQTSTSGTLLISLDEADVDQLNWKQLKRSFSNLRRNDSITISVRLNHIVADPAINSETYTVKGIKKYSNQIFKELQYQMNKN